MFLNAVDAIGESIFRLIPAILFALAATTADADIITGRAVGIADGDTITVLAPAKTQHKIRLSGIDAPEKGMPWSQQSKKSLSDMVLGREVTVYWHKVDRYGRTIGKVLVNGSDVNLAQVKAGMAWHYKQYEKEQPAEERTLYAEAENAARMLKKGLWSDPNPTPPWEWRHARRR